MKVSQRLLAAVSVIASLLIVGVTTLIIWRHADSTLSAGANSGSGTAPASSLNPITKGMSAALHSVSCPTKTFCLAVGSYSPDGSTQHQQPLVEDWNSGRWSLVPFAASSSEEALQAVACFSPRECIAVGSQTVGAASIFQAIALRWNGNSVATLAVPRSPSDTTLNGVACPSAHRCVAVGASRRGELPVALSALWNGGGTWSLERAATPPAAVDSYLNAVTCAQPSRCVAVGAYSSSGDHDDPESSVLVETWNGSVWALAPVAGTAAGSYSALESISCLDSTTCMAVGSYSATNDAYGDDAQRLVEMERNGSWELVHLPSSRGGGQSALQAIACASGDRCLAVGSSARTAYGSTSALLEVWDGERWAIDAMQLPDSTLESVSCPRPSSCVAVGEQMSGDKVEAVWWPAHP